MSRFLLVALLAISGNAWSTEPPPTFELGAMSFPSANDSTVAHVFLLRSNSLTGATRSFTVHLDGKKTAKLPWRRTSTELKLPEGMHTIKISCPSGCSLRPLAFQASFVAGQEYYFLIDPKYKRVVDFEMRVVTESTITFTSQIQQIARDEYLRLIETYSAIKTL
jgi:hypothetical protein